MNAHSFPRWKLVETDAELNSALLELEGATGPLAVDTERASGFRYRNNAFLVQLFREGSEIFLVDPLQIESMSEIQRRLGHEEWILHAATQDLPCLRELGLDPSLMFDTELAARLLGFERVGLGGLVEDLLGITLEKAHSAADWSRRPLPDSWLEYAAMDVALLPALQAALIAELQSQTKTDIARQEFEALVAWQPKPADPEAWRRLSGLHAVKQPANLAIARELWTARDSLARERDIAPGRLLPDASIIAAALNPPRSLAHLASMKTFTGRASRSEIARWWEAVLAGKTTEDLPQRVRRKPGEIPPHRLWSQRYPQADARLKAARSLLTEQAEAHNIPLENLLTPDTLRRLAWQPPETLDARAIAMTLQSLGARSWQVELTAASIAEAFTSVDEGSQESDPN